MIEVADVLVGKDSLVKYAKLLFLAKQESMGSHV